MTLHRALRGLPEVRAGADLAQLLAGALGAAALTLRADDVLVVAQKIVSKAEGRLVALSSVVPGARALELAALTGKDPRLVELILSESSEVRARGAGCAHRAPSPRVRDGQRRHRPLQPRRPATQAAKCCCCRWTRTARPRRCAQRWAHAPGVAPG